jgi:hypothetical protein
LLEERSASFSFVLVGLDGATKVDLLQRIGPSLRPVVLNIVDAGVEHVKQRIHCLEVEFEPASSLGAGSETWGLIEELLPIRKKSAPT